MTHLCVCGTRLICTWDMTHLYVGHDASVRGTRLFRMWDMSYCMWGTTHSYMGRNSFASGTWRIRMWDMTHPYVRVLNMSINEQVTSPRMSHVGDLFVYERVMSRTWLIRIRISLLIRLRISHVGDMTRSLTWLVYTNKSPAWLVRFSLLNDSFVLWLVRIHDSFVYE